MGQDDSNKMQETVQSAVQWFTMSVLAVPLISWVVYNIGLNLRVLVLGILVFCCILALINVIAPNPNHFISSGRSPPASVTEEWVLKKKGGRSTNTYWCDASLAFASIKDFSFTGSRKPVDFGTLLKEKGDVIGPYCVDDETRSIVFVETEPDFDPAETGPFYFQSQRDHAIRVYTVPFEEYHRVVAALDPEMSSTKQLLMVYNTSRCGSTLLSKCLDQISNTRSISEPDIMTSLTHIASEAHGTRDADIIALARSSAKLLCYLRRRRYPNCETVCIKFRFQMVFISELIQKALPDAKAIFLYRNALDVIDSMCAAFISSGLYLFIRKWSMDTFYIYSVSTLPKNFPKLMPMMNDIDRFPQSCYKPLGSVGPFVITWISVMHYALNASRDGSIHACIRYEDMILGKTALVSKMLSAVGLLPSDGKGKEDFVHSDEVFKRDAHSGNDVTQSKRTVFNEDTGALEIKGFAYLHSDDPESIRDVLARHEEIEHSDFIIPGTIAL
jgi:hypothetical protein